MPTEQRNNEIEALSSIYGDSIQIQATDTSTSTDEVTLTYKYDNIISITFNLKCDYPQNSSPSFVIKLQNNNNNPDTLYFDKHEKQKLISEIDIIIHENIGCESLFLIIQKVNDTIDEKKSLQVTPNLLNTEGDGDLGLEYVDDQINVANFISSSSISSGSRVLNNTVPSSIFATSSPSVSSSFNPINIIHGEVTKEKKSSFQSHMYFVHSMEDVRAFREFIVTDKRYMSATHNIFAYRFMISNISYHDFDDDGETAAGGRLAEMIRLMKVEGIALIVSRWFGGTLLGPDRFKFICNSARTLLENNGFGNKPPPSLHAAGVGSFS